MVKGDVNLVALGVFMLACVAFGLGLFTIVCDLGVWFSAFYSETYWLFLVLCSLLGGFVFTLFVRVD